MQYLHTYCISTDLWFLVCKQVAILCIFYCFRIRKTKLDVDNNGKTRHNSTAWNGQFKIVSRSRPFCFWNYFFWALLSEISFSWNILYGIPSFCNLNSNPFFEKHDCPKKDVSWDICHEKNSSQSKAAASVKFNPFQLSVVFHIEINLISTTYEIWNMTLWNTTWAEMS